MARAVVSTGRLKARRRRRRALLAAAAVFVLLILLGCLVWLSQAPFLRIVAIEVSGTKTIASSSVELYVLQQTQGSYGQLFARNNIFLYPRSRIEDGLLEQNPTFRSVDVHAKDFHTVEVIVAERQSAALWCPMAGSADSLPAGFAEASCYFMDETGLLYAPAPNFNDSPYLTYQGTATTTSQPGLWQYLTAEEFQSLAALVAALGTKEPNNLIRQVVVDESKDVRAYFQNDFILIFSLKDGGGDTFERFALALESSAFAGRQLSDFEYLDLRFGDKLYYKLK